MPFHCRFHDQMARNVFSQINVTTLLRCYKMSNNLLFLVPVEPSISRQLHGSEVFLSFLLLLLLFSYLIKKGEEQGEELVKLSRALQKIGENFSIFLCSMFIERYKSCKKCEEFLFFHFFLPEKKKVEFVRIVEEKGGGAR